MRIPRTLWNGDHQRTLTMAEQRMVDLLAKGWCDCLTVGEPMEAEELFLTRYYPLNRSNEGNWCFGENLKPLFSIGNASRLNDMTETGSVEEFDLRGRMSWSLYGRNQWSRGRKKIYSNMPIDWRAFRTLSVEEILSSDGRDYVETAEMTAETLNPVWRDDYRGKLLAELKYSVYMDAVKMQSEICGYHKSPFLEPHNPLLDSNTLANYNVVWNSDLDWIKHDTNSLDSWARKFNEETIREFRSLSRYLKENVKRYRDENQLENTALWLDDFELPRHYVHRLKVYSQHLNLLFCWARECLETVLDRYALLQSDFMRVCSTHVNR